MSTMNVLALFAHPDDETILVGGTLAMLHSRGHHTMIVCATRGEGGELGDPPVVTDQALLGDVRTEELRCASMSLGVDELTWLGYVDPAIGPHDTLGAFDANFETLVAQIAGLVEERRIDVVLSHGPDGEYGHPAHKLVYAAIREAVVKHAPRVLFYSSAASIPGVEDRIQNESRIAHFALDITPWAEEKVAAMECHVSQHALFKRRRNLTAVREALRIVEAFYREWPEPPANGSGPDDAFAQLMRSAGATPISG